MLEFRKNRRNGDDTVPLVIGVTGHRAMREEDRKILYRAVIGELKRLMDQCPDTPLLMLNSLAEGADLLCADAAKELDIPLAAVLPAEMETYARDYSETDRQRFTEHVNRSVTCFIAPDQEPGKSGNSPDDAFRQAGIFVVTHCHVLLALWDGTEGEPGGCGTSEMVRIALTGDFAAEEGVSARSSENTAVIWIRCPRGGNGNTAGEVEYLGNTDAFGMILSRTDSFNRDAKRVRNKRTDPLFSGTVQTDGSLLKMERIYAVSDALSIRYARRYRLALALLAFLGTLLALSFLLYDEAELHWMILFTGLALLLMVLVHRYAAHSDWHRKYLDYRVLAESLRVQAFLRYAGSGLQVFEILPLTQQERTAWVLLALCALTACEPSGEKRSVRIKWAEKQRDYHLLTGTKASKRRIGSDRIVQITVILSAALYLSALLFELLTGGIFTHSFASPAKPELYRTILKIALGAISAGTLFIANYYGKQSLSREESDHGKMVRFYEKMSKRLSAEGETEQLLRHLAREELIENGNWYAYQSENTPDINL